MIVCYIGIYAEIYSVMFAIFADTVAFLSCAVYLCTKQTILKDEKF